MIRIRELRSEKNLTQSELATLLGIAKTTLAAYEQGKNEPNIAMLTKMASFFDVTIDYLIGYTDICTKNIEDRAIAEKTGLTLCSIDMLSGFQRNAQRKPNDAFDATPAKASLYLATLNKILHPMCHVLENMTYYLYSQPDCFYDDDCSDKKSYKHISELVLFDKTLRVSCDSSADYLAQTFLLMVQKELMQLRDEIQQ